MSRARSLLSNQTTVEQRLWSRLRDRQLGGHKFRRQVPRGSYVVDFACLRKKLIVELDGGQHSDPEQRARDQARSAWLEGEGYRVLRFWNNDVLTNMDGIVKTISQALGGPDISVSGQPTAEGQLWARLRNRQLEGHKFRRQVPLGRFIVDLACYDARLVIEVDGGQHAERKEEDAARTQWLEERGFRVLRFWNNEVQENIEAVLVRIAEVLENQKPPHPDPLPEEERE